MVTQTDIFFMFIVSEMSEAETSDYSEKVAEKASLLEDAPLKEKQGTVHKVKGIFTACLWVIFMVISIVSVQLLERRIPDFELNAARCALPFLLSIIVILTRRQLPVIAREEIVSTTWYSILSFICSVTLYVASSLLPVSSVQSVSQTSNIVSGIILFYLFLEDRPTLQVWISTLMCTGGVLLVIQPSFIFHHTTPAGNYSTIPLLSRGINGNSETTDLLNGLNSISADQNHIVYTLLQIMKYSLPVANGLSMTIDIVVVKKRPYLSENITEVLFWCFLSNTVLSFVVMFIWETPVLPSNWFDTLLVSLHCLAYVFIWPLYLYTVKQISGNAFVLISCMTIVILLTAQYTVLSSILPGNRNWMEVMGVILVFVGSTLVSIIEIWKKTK